MSKEEVTDYSPNPLDRLKNKIAREDGFEDWNEAMFKLGTGSLMLLVDKVIEQHTIYLTDQIKSMESYISDVDGQVKELSAWKDNAIDIAQKLENWKDSLQSQFESLQKESDELRQSYKICKDAIDKVWEPEYKKKKDECEALILEKIGDNVIYQNLKVQLSELTEERDLYKDSCSNMSTNSINLEKKLREQISRLNNKIQQLQKEKSLLEEVVLDGTEQIGELQKENAQRGILILQTKEANRKLYDKNEELKTENATLEKVASRAQDHAEELLKKQDKVQEILSGDVNDVFSKMQAIKDLFN